MRLLPTVITASLLLLSVPARATSGNELMSWLPDYEKSSGSWGGGMFMGYVTGVAEVGEAIFYCSPKNATHGQTAAIVAKYLRNNPEKWNLPAGSLIISALQSAYPPCPSKK